MADSLIENTLRILDDLDRDTIMEAFNSMQQHIIKLPDQKFLAVHAENHPNLIIEESANYWLYGSFKE